MASQAVSSLVRGELMAETLPLSTRLPAAWKPTSIASGFFTTAGTVSQHCQSLQRWDFGRDWGSSLAKRLRIFVQEAELHYSEAAQSMVGV